jgi:hypothetical protein
MNDFSVMMQNGLGIGGPMKENRRPEGDVRERQWRMGRSEGTVGHAEEGV